MLHFQLICCQCFAYYLIIHDLDNVVHYRLKWTCDLITKRVQDEGQRSNYKAAGQKQKCDLVLSKVHPLWSRLVPAPLYTHIFMLTCTEPQYTLAPTQTRLECLPERLHCGGSASHHYLTSSAGSRMRARTRTGTCARTQTRRQAAAPLRTASEDTHIAAATFTPVSAPSRPPPELGKPRATREPPGAFWVWEQGGGAQEASTARWHLSSTVSQPCLVLSTLSWADRLTMSEQTRKHERNQNYFCQLGGKQKKRQKQLE